jgi:hypothetical protein
MLYKISWRILAFLVLLLFIKRVFPGRSLLGDIIILKSCKNFRPHLLETIFLFQNRKTLVNHVKYSSSVTCIKWIPTEVHTNLGLIINQLIIICGFFYFHVLESDKFLLAWIYRKVFIFYYFIFLAEEGLSKCFQMLK